MKLSKSQKEDLIDLLWDDLRKDLNHSDRKRTGWGGKTKDGLVASIEDILNKEEGE